MSETAAAPAAAAPTASAPADSSSTQIASGEMKAAESKAAAWDSAREAKLLEEFKASPFAKFKANGKDETIDSAEKLKAMMLDASRGRGASKLAEEAKREKAEAASVKQRAELLERALEGDEEALAALGKEKPGAKQAREAALAEIPPEVRAVIEELEATKAKVAKFEAERAQQQKAEADRRAQAQQEQVRTEALGFAKTLAEQLESGDDAEQVLPYVLRSWHELTSEGLQANVDVTPEHVITLARQMFEAEGVGRVEKLAPKSFLGAALKRLETMPVKDVVAGLSPKMRVAIARELAQQKMGAKTQAQTAPRPVETKDESPARMSSPLGAFRWAK